MEKVPLFYFNDIWKRRSLRADLLALLRCILSFSPYYNLTEIARKYSLLLLAKAESVICHKMYPLLSAENQNCCHKFEFQASHFSVVTNSEVQILCGNQIGRNINLQVSSHSTEREMTELKKKNLDWRQCFL